MNSVNGFCHGNATVALRKHQCQYPDLRQPNRSVCNGTPQSVGKMFSHATSALATGDTMCRMKREFSMLYILVY
jgi:hypothetical protein